MPVTTTPGALAAKAVLPSIGETPGSHKSLVLVHGAGRFVPSDYDPVINYVENKLGKPIDAFRVVYADVLNQPPGTVAAAAAPSPAALQLQAQMENELARDALARAIDSVPSNQLVNALVAGLVPGGNSLLAALAALLKGPSGAVATDRLLPQLQKAFPGVPLADWLNRLTATGTPGAPDISATIRQVSQYLAQPDIATRMQARLIDALEQATRNFEEVVIASHSLGTVIAFDVLHDHADTYNKISHLFTLGCPLLKLQRLGRRSDLGPISYGTIKHWFNVYDTTDLVANALGPGFSTPDYLLYDIYVDIAQAPIPAHDYFNNSDTLDLISAAMR